MVLELIIGGILFISGLLGGIVLTEAKTPKSHRNITGSSNDDESVNQKLRELDQGLTDLSDKVTHWMRRSNMRQLREIKEAAAEDPTPTPGEKAELTKQDLRRRVFNARSNIE